MKLRTIVILALCVVIMLIFVLYKFLLVPLFMYGWATGAFIIISHQKKIKLNCKDFLNKYSWSYLGVSLLLIFLAGVNSIGYHNRTKEYQKCFDAEINDTVVSLESWGKMGNKVRLTNGESFGIFIDPLT